MPDQHKDFIRASIVLAKRAKQKGNQPFGALLVHNEKIILEGENSVFTDRDLTRHAELNLVSEAMRSIPPEQLMQATLYASTEPCAMCAGAIYWSGIPRVVYSVSAETWTQMSPNGLLLPCRDVFKHGARTVQVIGPVLEKEGLSVHQGYW